MFQWVQGASATATLRNAWPVPAPTVPDPECAGASTTLQDPTAGSVCLFIMTLHGPGQQLTTHTNVNNATVTATQTDACSTKNSTTNLDTVDTAWTAPTTETDQTVNDAVRTTT